jgi:hypothetical protein
VSVEKASCADLSTNCLSRRQPCSPELDAAVISNLQPDRLPAFFASFLGGRAGAKHDDLSPIPCYGLPSYGFWVTDAAPNLTRSHQAERGLLADSGGGDRGPEQAAEK